MDNISITPGGMKDFEVAVAARSAFMEWATSGNTFRPAALQEHKRSTRVLAIAYELRRNGGRLSGEFLHGMTPGPEHGEIEDARTLLGQQ